MIDQRKKYYLVIDVETANSLEDPIVYDVGFIVGDKKGNIYEKYSFSVSEMFNHYKELLTNAYYAEKLPIYGVEEKAGTRIKTSLYYIRKALIETMRRYNIKEVYAYNASFDSRALNNTQRYMTYSKYRWFFPYGTQIYCIWNMACTTIFQQASFKKRAKIHNWYSKSGMYIGTNAEIAYRYITGDYGFIEQHRGLDDVLIEYQILLCCLRQHKKMDKSINRLCWRLVK